MNECEVVELDHGPLMLNMRNSDRSERHRQVAYSDDGGLSWRRDQRADPALIELVCQASICRLRLPAAGEPGVILFSNPASTSAHWNLKVRAPCSGCCLNSTRLNIANQPKVL